MSTSPQSSHFVDFYFKIRGLQSSFCATNTAMLCLIYVEPTQTLSVSQIAKMLRLHYNLAWNTVSRMQQAGLCDRDDKLVVLTDLGRLAMRCLHGDADPDTVVVDDDEEPGAD